MPRSSTKKDEVTRIFLKGRKVISVDGRITIEIEADSMDWDPESIFEATLEDGTRVTLKVDKTLSTRRSKVNAGAVLRLTFEAPPTEVEAISFTASGVMYRVEV